MKTIALALGVSLTIGSLSAQECPAAKAAAKAACQGQKAATCEVAQGCSSKNDVTVAFQKLDKDQKVAVTKAFTQVIKTCPVGSKVPGTVMALDRLYGEAVTSLTKLAKQDKLPEGLRKDAKASLELVTKLRGINSQNMATMKMIAGVKDKGCDDGCDAACCEEAKGCCMSQAGDLTKKWSTAMADLEKVSKCEKTMASMKADFDVLQKHGIHIQKFVTANLKSQLELMNKGGGAIACSKGGLAAKHKNICDQCDWTSGNISKTVSSIVAAHKLVKAVPFLTKNAKAAPKGECSESKGECSESKGECSETAPKGECSASKKECASSKKECSSKTKTKVNN